MAKTLLTPTTSAGNSDAIRVNKYNVIAISVPGLAGVETADLKYSIDGGANWVAYYKDDAAYQFTATNTRTNIEGPVLVRVEKGATAGAVGVYVSAGDDL